MRSYFLLLCLLLSFYGYSQQNKIKIQGSISDSLQSPIANATLVLTKAGTNKKVADLISSQNGKFNLQADTGLYNLNITAVGFLFKSIKIVAATDVDMGAIILSPDSKTLNEVIVKGERPLIEQKADRLIYNAEKDLSAIGGTAADLLRNVPMLSLDGNGNVQMRGSSNIRVLINNRPSNIFAASVADALRQLPADMIKTVEVITSPSAKYDAEGTAGVINIITKKNMLQGLTGSLNIVPGYVSTIGSGNLTFRRRGFGVNGTISTNQFYNRGEYYLERNNFADGSSFIQDGKTRNRSGFINPQLGFDVTLNAKNSIGGGARLNTQHDFVKNDQFITNTFQNGQTTIYDLDLTSRTKGLGYDLNLDYLKTFKDPQQEFSFLTLYSKSSFDNEAFQDQYNGAKALTYQQRNLNQSQNVETTFQADYTHPLKNKTTLEVGAKTVLRKAGSDVDYKSIYPLIDEVVTSENIFSYHQNVIAAYATYSFKAFKLLNVKIGSRYEKTDINADFKTRDLKFSSGYDNFIPSINAAITFKEKHTIRAAYTQRLQRPQLFFLNPYREVIAPKIIRVGNPQLNAEVSDLFEINYGTYGKNFSFNTNVYARVTDNAVATDISLKNDTTYTTFLNIAKNKTFGVSVFGSVKPIKALSVNSSVNLFHLSLDGMNTTNKGWMYGINLGYTLDLGKGWFHAFNSSFNSRQVVLQGRRASFSFHNTTLRKDILKKKGALGINLANPLTKGTRFRTNLLTPTFEQIEDNINFTRGVRLTLTYRFGQLQQAKAPRKPKKTINNDDALRTQ